MEKVRLLPGDDYQHIALVNGLALAGFYLFDNARARGGEVILHFHGFNHQQPVATRSPVRLIHASRAGGDPVA